MHLAIDCRSIHPHMGGIGRAALELVRELGVQARGHRITMIVSSHAGEVSARGIHILPVDAAMIDEPFEQLRLPSLLAELRADLYLNTTFAVPAVKTTKIQAAIIHDIVFEDRPELVEAGLRSYLSKWSRFTATHADHVLTVSDHALGRIEEAYGTSRSRLSRIYNGLAPACFVTPPGSEIARVCTKFELKPPFILYLGTIEIKKGIRELVAAYRRAADRGLTLPLILAGGKGGPGFDFDQEIRQAGCSGCVRSLGYIEEGDKQALLAACDVFVYPSLYEGFGLPPLEALALGKPCLVSDQTSLPEIVGSAAIVTRVEDADQFSKDLLECSHDAAFRRTAASAGPARAREFSWARSATELLTLCERLGEN